MTPPSRRHSSLSGDSRKMQKQQLRRREGWSPAGGEVPPSQEAASPHRAEETYLRGEVYFEKTSASAVQDFKKQSPTGG